MNFYIFAIQVLCGIWLIYLIYRCKQRLREIGKLQESVKNNLENADRLLSMAEKEYKKSLKRS
ncbi:MAG: hypothetical protein PHI85_09235 [Victivallaceae bacterium]|nr:hypothetical protein [Victivallaceae bacterium]